MVQSKDTDAILKENYHPTTYKGDAPEPLPKVNDELPWEQLNKKIGQFHEKVDEKLKQANEKKAQLEEKNEIQTGGAVSTIVGAATNLLSKVSNKVEQGLQEFTKDAMGRIEELQKTRLRQYFNVESDETLMYEYTCSIFNEDSTGSLGWLYVTTEHLGFWSDCGDYQIKLWFPLKNIVSIQPGTALTKKDGKGVFIQRVESAEVMADSILVYTKDNEVHKFYKLGAGHDPINTYWSHAWNVLDHAWRDSGVELKDKKSEDQTKEKSSKDSQKEGSKDSSKSSTKDSSSGMKSDFHKGAFDTSTYGSSRMGAGVHSTITAAGYGSSGLISNSASTPSTETSQFGAHGSSAGGGAGLWSEIGTHETSTIDSTSDSNKKDAGWVGLSDSVLSGGKTSDFSGDPIGTSETTNLLSSDTTTSGTPTGLISDTTVYGTMGGLGSDSTTYGTTSGLGSDTTSYGTTSGLGADKTSYGTTSGLSSDTTSYGTTSGLNSATEKLDSEKPSTGSVF